MNMKRKLQVGGTEMKKVLLFILTFAFMFFGCIVLTHIQITIYGNFNVIVDFVETVKLGDYVLNLMLITIIVSLITPKKKEELK